MTNKEAARMIDISTVRTAHTLQDIEHVAAIAKQYGFINVHSLPCWTKEVARLLADEPQIFVGAPVGFPGGGHKTQVKLLEAQLLIEDGVEEMDIMMNVGRFKNKEYGYVLDELNQVIALAPKNVLTKILVEINALTDAELESACALVMETNATFLKTGTGWIPGDANIDRIARIKKLTHGKIKVKAAGGIRTKEQFEALCALGVERFGINTNSALDIVSSYGN